jgi:hypothetical protein
VKERSDMNAKGKGRWASLKSLFLKEAVANFRNRGRFMQRYNFISGLSLLLALIVSITILTQVEIHAQDTDVNLVKTITLVETGTSERPLSGGGGANYEEKYTAPPIVVSQKSHTETDDREINRKDGKGACQCKKGMEERLRLTWENMWHGKGIQRLVLFLFDLLLLAGRSFLWLVCSIGCLIGF